MSLVLKNVFDPEVTAELIERVRRLRPDTRPLWGKMDVAQMLAHCCVTYEMAYEDRHRRPGPFARFLLRVFVKETVVGKRPYRRNLRTAPAFLIRDPREFEKEQGRLIAYLEHTRELGRAHFEGRESLSFGPLTAEEWSIMFYKHLDHHLTQFGV